MKEVVVVIPVHTNNLNEFEWKSIRQCVDVLSEFEIVIAKPESLNINNILEIFPQINPVNFPDKYFQNIVAYNQLMMSQIFYQKFLEFKFILIYQTDAWIFKNELRKWIELDFDYVGAPWLKKEKHREWYYQFFQTVVSDVLKIPLKSKKLGGRPGNGGFSLRKTLSHYQVCIKKQHLIQKYIRNSVNSSLFNEDVFWSTENPEFLYPDFETSLKFAWDQFPDKAFEASKGILPLGCHGWFKTTDQLNFWKNII